MTTTASETTPARASVEVPYPVRQRVNSAARELWLALRELSDYYLTDCDQIPDADMNLWAAVSAHPAVKDRLK